MKRKNGLKRFCAFVIAIYCFIAPIFIIFMSVHENMLVTPKYEKIDIVNILEKENWSEEDYQTVFLQTGVTKIGVDSLRKYHDFKQRLLRLQDKFFTEYSVACDDEFFTHVDHLYDENGNKTSSTDIVPLENGDVLFSFGGHTIGWRHGHCGIVVDEKKGYSLESASLGEKSDVYYYSLFAQEPILITARLKNSTKEERNKIAEYAYDKLIGLDYWYFPTSTKDENGQNRYNLTYCSHLVWAAFNEFGYNTDSSGRNGFWVTPKGILRSGMFEIIQIHGIDARKVLNGEF